MTNEEQIEAAISSLIKETIFSERKLRAASVMGFYNELHRGIRKVVDLGISLVSKMDAEVRRQEIKRCDKIRKKK